jgi:O-antigen/teichoic acid export membrane protein
MLHRNDKNSYQGELFHNQLWQSLNFAAKAGFLFLLTPLMLSKWGAEGFGLFALSSSLLVSMALLDAGVRSLTRLRLAQARNAGDEEAFRRAYSEGLAAFASVVFCAGGVAVLLALGGQLGRWLRISGEGQWVLVLTVFLTGLLMLTLLALEPVAAGGRLSLLKSANTLGALVAIPLVAGFVWWGASVATTVGVYSACLIVPNLVLAWQFRLFALKPWRYLPGVRAIARIFQQGVWFYLTTVALVVKTHALTFLVSAMAGPSVAGLFYVLLRITELVGNVGATASETSLAALAAAGTPERRASLFMQSWRYAALFCLHGALLLAILGDDFVHLWLAGAETLPPGVGPALAFFGLCGAFGRVVVNAAMGLEIIRAAALANLAEAGANILLAALGYRLAGLAGLFWGGGLGVVFLLSPTWLIASLCGKKTPDLYIEPLKILLPGLLLAGVLQGTAAALGQPVWWFASVAGAGAIGLVQLLRLHR